ncbi:hypothetical protein RUND412_005710 [Rhizina undulata]
MIGPPTRITNNKYRRRSSNIRVFDVVRLWAYGEFDTASVYRYVSGKSESFLAKAGFKDLNFNLATKVTRPSPESTNPTASLRQYFGSHLKPWALGRTHKYIEFTLPPTPLIEVFHLRILYRL